MRVLLVATVQSHICQFHKPLVSMLHEHGCEVHVAARNNLAEKNGLALDFVDQVFDLPFERSPFSGKNVVAYQDLKRIIARGGYDVVHTNTPVGGMVGRLAARKARKSGCKVFYTAHGFHFFQGGPKKSWIFYYPLERLMCRYTDELITVNEEDERLARKKFRVCVSRIHGVGADSGRYAAVSERQCAELRKSLGFSRRKSCCSAQESSMQIKIKSQRSGRCSRWLRGIPRRSCCLPGMALLTGRCRKRSGRWSSGSTSCCWVTGRICSGMSRRRISLSHAAGERDFLSIWLRGDAVKKR